PSVLDALLNAPGARDVLARLRHLFCGGEALSLSVAKSIHALRPALLKNLYGPAEATIDATCWSFDAEADRRTVPIGRAIDNTQTYIVGADLALVPDGAVGELWLGGKGLARGYHRRSHLTGDRFVPDPFGSAPGGRLYRTGDLVRRRDDGAIEYIGRIDHQVKIRGHRIEVGEIEERLREYEGVQEAVVVARDIGATKQLIAYVVGAGEWSADEHALRDYLRRTLPDAMVPSRVVALAEMPLTPHGKIDRRALPEPDRRSSEYRAPETELARAIAEIWQRVLRIEQPVGMEDNFFELGGDSILAMQVMAQIGSELQLQVSLRALFDARDLAEFERAVGASSVLLAQAGE
ncbi:MAG TPA: AMP-binding protein, partial [Polyangiales bacterium]|nr:AMP-binding protein [Polyangiales bacterium]